ncbi:MAG TPA: hypothetical protein VII52_15380 [Gemmatimonadaceae bacterium]
MRTKLLSTLAALAIAAPAMAQTHTAIAAGAAGRPVQSTQCIQRPDRTGVLRTYCGAEAAAMIRSGAGTVNGPVINRNGAVINRDRQIERERQLERERQIQLERQRQLEQSRLSARDRQLIRERQLEHDRELARQNQLIRDRQIAQQRQIERDRTAAAHRQDVRQDVRQADHRNAQIERQVDHRDAQIQKQADHQADHQVNPGRGHVNQDKKDKSHGHDGDD